MSTRDFIWNLALVPLSGKSTISLPETVATLSTFSETGLALELKLGGAVIKNLVLTFDLFHNVIYGPKISTGGRHYYHDNNTTLSEITYGLGATWYLMPADVFVSGTFGMGRFSETVLNASIGGPLNGTFTPDQITASHLK